MPYTYNTSHRTFWKITAHCMNPCLRLFHCHTSFAPGGKSCSLIWLCLTLSNRYWCALTSRLPTRRFGKCQMYRIGCNNTVIQVVNYVALPSQLLLCMKMVFLIKHKLELPNIKQLSFFSVPLSLLLLPTQASSASFVVGHHLVS